MIRFKEMGLVVVLLAGSAVQASPVKLEYANQGAQMGDVVMSILDAGAAKHEITMAAPSPLVAANVPFSLNEGGALVARTGQLRKSQDNFLSTFNFGDMLFGSEIAVLKKDQRLMGATQDYVAGVPEPAALSLLGLLLLSLGSIKRRGS